MPLAAPNGRERRREGNSAARERIHRGGPDSVGVHIQEPIPLQSGQREGETGRAAGGAIRGLVSAIMQYSWPTCLAGAWAPILN